jgi:hypothetical protein
MGKAVYAGALSQSSDEWSKTRRVQVPELLYSHDVLGCFSAYRLELAYRICASVSKAPNMQIPHLIDLFHREMTAWRQDLHAHPELGFEEHRTSEFVAGKFAEFGCEVHRNIGKTGVVGVLRTGGGPSIGLSTDMEE